MKKQVPNERESKNVTAKERKNERGKEKEKTRGWGSAFTGVQELVVLVFIVHSLLLKIRQEKGKLG